MVSSTLPCAQWGVTAWTANNCDSRHVARSWADCLLAVLAPGPTQRHIYRCKQRAQGYYAAVPEWDSNPWPRDHVSYVLPSEYGNGSECRTSWMTNTWMLNVSIGPAVLDGAKSIGPTKVDDCVTVSSCLTRRRRKFICQKGWLSKGASAHQRWLP